MTPALLAAASGVLSASALPPFGESSLHWIAFVPMLVAARRTRGVASSFVVGAVGTMPMFVGAMYGLVAFRVVLALVPAVQTLGAAALVAVYATLCRDRDGVRAGLVFSGLWVLFETGTTLAGMPWALALTQTDNVRILQVASVLGMPAVSGAILLTNVAVAEATWRATGGAAPVRVMRPLVAAALLPAALATFGLVALRDDVAQPTVPVAVVQPALRSELYTYQWLNPEYRRDVRSVVETLSATAGAGSPALLVWPENGNGQYNFRVPALRDAIGDLARASGASLLLSSYDQDSEGRTYNAVFSVDPDGTVLGRYAKRRLAPGGEEGFVAGTERDPLPTRFGPVGALVCLESTLPWMARDLVRQGAKLLLVTTSDVSMRRAATPILHGRFAIFRAVESRRWVVVASNAGPSLVVDPWGRVRAETPFSARTILRADVGFEDRWTPYAAYGDVPILALAFVAACWGFVPSRRRGIAVAPEGSPAGRRDAAVGITVASAVAAATVAASLGVLSSAPVRRWPETVAAFVRPAAITVPLDAGGPSVAIGHANEAALAYALALLGVEIPTPGAGGGATALPFHALVDLARSFGMRSWVMRGPPDVLATVPKPVLADLGDHAVVVLNAGRETVDVFDPAAGVQRLAPSDFARRWTGDLLVVRFPPLPGVDRPLDPDGSPAPVDQASRHPSKPSDIGRKELL
jgi:apolipoprotein N-acyltransferase